MNTIIAHTLEEAAAAILAAASENDCIDYNSNRFTRYLATLSPECQPTITIEGITNYILAIEQQEEDLTMDREVLLDFNDED
jgi:hypothetical protein